jgi:pyruvate kinase
VTATRPGEGEFDAVVEIGGAVASRQGLNIPGGAGALPAVREVDLEHLRFGEKREDLRRPRRAVLRAPRR